MKQEEEKTIVRKLMLIHSYEIGAMEEYLEKQAEKGLFFRGSKGLFWIFQKGDPKRVRYCVDIFDRGSWFDTRAEGETLDYKEYCEQAGWNYICTRGKRQFFYSEKENAVPIETDQKRKLHMIHMGSLYETIILPLMSILFMCLFWGMQISNFMHSDNAIFEISCLDVNTMLLWLIIGIMGLTQFLRYIFFISETVSGFKRVKISNFILCKGLCAM